MTRRSGETAVFATRRHIKIVGVPNIEQTLLVRVYYFSGVSTLHCAISRRSVGPKGVLLEQTAVNREDAGGFKVSTLNTHASDSFPVDYCLLIPLSILEWALVMPAEETK